MIKSIYRKNLTDAKINGVILYNNKFFTVVANYSDFYFDGILFLANQYVSEIEIRNSDKVYWRVIKEIGETLNQIKVERFSGWKELFGGLRNNSVIIENEVYNEFWLGDVVRLYKISVRIKHYDGIGENVSCPLIKYDDITCVSIGTRYQNIFNKHILSCK